MMMHIDKCLPWKPMQDVLVTTSLSHMSGMRGAYKELQAKFLTGSHNDLKAW